jgi:hypothetical protein
MRYLAVLLLAGCSSLPHVPKKVLVPVSTPCISKLPDTPLFKTHEELKALNNADYVTQVTIELLEHEKYQQVMEALLKACN